MNWGDGGGDRKEVMAIVSFFSRHLFFFLDSPF